MEDPNVSNMLDNASKAYIIAESIKPLKDATTAIKSMFSGPVPVGKEIELRFGTITYNNKKNRNEFEPGMDGVLYVELFNRLRETTNYNFKTIFSKVENYEEGRIISYYDDFTMTRIKKVEYQKKKTLETYDMPLQPFSIRVSVAEEKELSPFKPRDEPRFQKLQTRYYFDFKYFEFHLSEIKNKDGIKYEVEVEVKDVSRFNDIVKASLILLTDKISIFGDDSYKNRILNFQSRLRSRYPYIGKKDDTFFDNKPRSISFSNAKAVSSGYVVTNKLDGVHYNLVFSKDFAYLVNATEVLLVSNADEDYSRFWNNVLGQKTTVLDGELVIEDNLNVVFYVFDVLIVKDENVSGMKDFLKRIESAKQIVESYNSSINKILKIKIKEMAYTDNVGNDIIKIFKYMISNYKDEYDKRNDGLVFIPVKGAYNDYIYKWKFPSRITMDGIIRRKEQTKNGIVYTFKFYKEDKSYDSLKYKGKDIDLDVYYSNPYSTVLKDGMIVEAKPVIFEIASTFFDIDRVRADKIRPNFIGIAEKTFKDALNPMNEEELLKYFKVPSSQIKEYDDYKRQREEIEPTKEEIVEEKKLVKLVKTPDVVIPEPTPRIRWPITFVLSKEKLTSKELSPFNTPQVIKEPIVVKPTQEETEISNALKSLAANKAKDMTVLFSENVFTRIGTIGDGSCFIHSVLFSIYKYGYTKISTDDKYKYASLVRKKMSNDLEFGRWSELGKGELAKMLTDIAMLKTLKEDKEKEYQQAVLDFKSSSDRLFYDYIKYMRPKFTNIVEVAKKEYEKYKKTLNSCEYFNDSMFEYASMFFDVNIFIVRDLSRKVEPISLELYKPGRSSIFVLHIDSKYSKYGKDFSNIDHFEVLAIKSEAGLETLFDEDSKVVQDALVSMTQMVPVEKKTELVVVEVPSEEKEEPEIKIIEVEKTEEEPVITEEIIEREVVKKVMEIETEKKDLSMEEVEVIKKEFANIDGLYFMRNKDREIKYLFV